jgi:hypothetical protein
MHTETQVTAADSDWRLRTLVPGGIFTLAIEADDEAAAAEHAAFAERCLPVLAAQQPSANLGTLRQSVIAELAALRRAVAASGLGYLGAIAGEQDGRAALILLSIAATRMEFPQAVDAAALLHAIARRAYPGAAVEEFSTQDRTGIGIRRADELTLPVAQLPTTDDLGVDELRVDTGISQALVPFPEAGLLAAVNGYCFNVHDVDVATIFTATIAYRMSAVARS